MSSGQLLVFGGSVLWILLCMRFWRAIDPEHLWQRRCIAIAAGLGGGMVYIIGTLMLQVLKEKPVEDADPAAVRVQSGTAAGKR